MLVSIHADNFMVFQDGWNSNVSMISFCGDMIHESSVIPLKSSGSLLKSCCIFGPDNSGKSCIIHAAECIRDSILGHVNERYMRPNKETGSSIISLGTVIYHDGEAYGYDFKYDCEKKLYVYECLVRLVHGLHFYHPSCEHIILMRDVENDDYQYDGGQDVRELIKASAGDQLLIHSMKDAIGEHAAMMEAFAASIDIVDMNAITLEKTTRALKYNTPLKERTLQIIRQAQLFFEDYAYVSDSGSGEETAGPAADVAPEDYRHLYSYHKGVPYLSVECDSPATLKTVALASWIADAYDNGRILFIDDMNGLYFRLNQALIGLFNCGCNCTGQLILTTSDFSMLDCKCLFRPDQIMFMDRFRDDIWCRELRTRKDPYSSQRSLSDIMNEYEKLNFLSPSRPGFFDFVENTPSRKGHQG